MIGFEVEVVEGGVGRGEDKRLELEGLWSLVGRHWSSDSTGKDGKKAEKELHLIGGFEFERKQRPCVWSCKSYLYVEMRNGAESMIGD